MLSLTLAFTTLSAVAAFQDSVVSLSPATLRHQKPSFRTPTTLGVGWAMDSNEDVQLLYSRAKDCAYGEDGGECSIEDASVLLSELTFLLSKCGIGKRGSDNAVCENQDVAAEIVSKLRVIASPSGSGVAISSEKQGEDSAWKTTVWTILTDFDVPLAVLYYFLCIFCMIHFGEFGVNSVDIGENSAKINELYMSDVHSKVNDYYMSATSVPAAFMHYRMF